MSNSERGVVFSAGGFLYVYDSFNCLKLFVFEASDTSNLIVSSASHLSMHFVNLYQLSCAATQDAVHLLTSMLTFDYVSELFEMVR